MLRQRLRDRTSWIEPAGRIILLLVCLALVWYGLMVVLLAFKVSPGTVNAISGYRTIYDNLAGLDGADITGTVRLIAGLGGLAGFLLFGWLAWKEIPRPYLARTDIGLKDDERGVIGVGPRAMERAGEAAALGNSAVVAATGRFGGDDLALDIDVRRARDLAATLRDVQRRAVTSLGQHGLPAVKVNVTLTGIKRTTRRELA
jgi:hypothetical protein